MKRPNRKRINPAAVATRMLVRAEVAERRYVRGVQNLFDHIQGEYLALADMRMDSGIHKKTPWLAALEIRILALVRSAGEKLFDRMAIEVVAASAWAIKDTLPAITLADTGFSAQMAVFREANLSLLDEAFREYAGAVRVVFESPSAIGATVSQLQELLKQAGVGTRARAELIARDQTLKFNGQLAKARQVAAGVLKYTWVTSRDERVRATHKALDRRVFHWGEPTPIGYEPGQDYQCRCVAVPVLDHLDNKA